jgi:hypothetical protein
MHGQVFVPAVVAEIVWKKYIAQLVGIPQQHAHGSKQHKRCDHPGAFEFKGLKIYTKGEETSTKSNPFHPKNWRLSSLYYIFSALRR